MFDIAFSELILIAIVALLVIGPEQLPKVARTAGRWFGKMRQFVRTVQADIEREVRAEELKRIVDEQARSSGIYDILETTQDASAELKRAVDEVESLKMTAAKPSTDTPDMDAPVTNNDVAPEADKKAAPVAETKPADQPAKNDTPHG